MNIGVNICGGNTLTEGASARCAKLIDIDPLMGVHFAYATTFGIILGLRYCDNGQARVRDEASRLL